MTMFEMIATLLTLVAILGIINHHTLRLPRTIGLMAGSLALSVVIILIDRSVDVVELRQAWRDLVDDMDLPHVFLDGALGFMLFAGTLHVDMTALRAQKWIVLALATIGVVLAAVVYGAGIWLIFAGSVPFTWCLVLGTILAPTDPVAVGGLLREAGLPAAPMAMVIGESLFNDGVALVLFTLSVNIATAQPSTLGHAMLDLMREAGGGIGIGLLLGFLAYRALRLVDDVALDLTITLALATLSYSLAHAVHASGPLAVVVAGMAMNHKRAKAAMSEASRRQVIAFWDMMDELLNALLFLLMGFALLSLQVDGRLVLAAAAGIALALATRLVSVALPTALLHFRDTNLLKSITVLTWGGLRGGISVALVLTLDPSPYRGALLVVCYAVVVFTILVQGLTMPRLVRRLYPRAA